MDGLEEGALAHILEQAPAGSSSEEGAAAGGGAAIAAGHREWSRVRTDSRAKGPHIS